MPNYKEEVITGSVWQRANLVQIHNTLNAVPSIVFYEEEVVSVPSGPVTRNVGQITESFSDPTIEFNLVHPETGIVLGTASYQQIYLLLHSLYMHLAHIRDNPVLPVVPPDIPPSDEPPIV